MNDNVTPFPRVPRQRKTPIRPGIRQRATAKFDASAGFRLTVIGAMVVLNVAVMPLTAHIESAWIGVPVMLLWILILSGFFIWIFNARPEWIDE